MIPSESKFRAIITVVLVICRSVRAYTRRVEKARSIQLSFRPHMSKLTSKDET